MPLPETLDALDELISTTRASGRGGVEWKGLLRSMGTRTRRYSAWSATPASRRPAPPQAPACTTSSKLTAALPSLLEAYVKDLLARAMGTSPARIDTQQSLRNLGLDSLIAVEVRNRIMPSSA